MRDVIKPCPFCGGKARLFGDSILTWAGNVDWYVECTKCHAATDHMASEKGAINRWNKRTKHE